jgi:hypothetical protein
MGKLTLAVFLLIALTLLSPALLKATVSAAKPGYTINNYIATTVPTIDGNWTTPDEWTDAEERELDGSLTVYFSLKYKLVSGTSYNYVLIDFLNDTTDDSSDGWMICIDAHHDGGSTPQTDDYRISLTGHSFSGLHVYKGDGSSWVETTDFNWGTDLAIVNGINPSPHLSTPHWICEFKINATWCDLLNDYTIRVAASDASGGGNQVWPDSTSSVPDDWGQTVTKFEVIPEFSSLLIPLVLMTAALIAVLAYKRKQIPQA